MSKTGQGLGLLLPDFRRVWCYVTVLVGGDLLFSGRARWSGMGCLAPSTGGEFLIISILLALLASLGETRMRHSMIALFMIAVGFLGLTAGPALAAQITVEFARADGTVTVAVFDDVASTVTIDANTVPYTLDPATKTLCAAAPDGEMCVVFAELVSPMTVGFTTAYETNTGMSGVATVTAIE